MSCQIYDNNSNKLHESTSTTRELVLWRTARRLCLKTSHFSPCSSSKTWSTFQFQWVGKAHRKKQVWFGIEKITIDTNMPSFCRYMYVYRIYHMISCILIGPSVFKYTCTLRGDIIHVIMSRQKTHFFILICSLSPTHLAHGEALWVLSWCHAPQVPKNCIWTILHPPKYALVPGRSRRTCKYITSLYIDTFVQQLYAYICIHNSISTSNITYIHIHATFSAFPCKHPRIPPSIRVDHQNPIPSTCVMAKINGHRSGRAKSSLKWYGACGNCKQLTEAGDESMHATPYGHGTFNDLIGIYDQTDLPFWNWAS